MRYYKKIIGEKVYLSPINKEDAETYTKWLNDYSVTDGTGASYRLYTYENELKWVEENLTNSSYNFAIIDKETDTLIGNCGISDLNHLKRIATVGIFLGEEEYRSKGYGSDALKALVDFGFNFLNLNNIDLKVYSFNSRAIRCYEKVGFKKYGTRHGVYPLKGEVYDEIFMEILRENYMNK